MIRTRIATVATVVACVGLSGVAVQATADATGLRAMAAGATVRVSVDIGRDTAGMTALVTAVSDPHSPQYRHFLTPQQVSASFGATDAQRSAVSKWLTSTGMTVTHTDPFTVTAVGTAADAGNAVASPLVSTGSANTTQVRADTGIKIPADVAPDVRSVHLSGQTPLRAQPMSATAPTTTTPTTDGPHCSAFFGQIKATGLPADPAVSQLTYAPCGYAPALLRDAYGLTAAGLTGKGATVGIISPLSFPTAVTDLNQWSALNGVQPLVAGQFTQDVSPGALDNLDQLGESPLDLEAVHGMAPDADILFSVGDGTITGSELLDSLDQIVSTRGADVVTTSWADDVFPGIDQSLIDAWDAVLERAALEGITVDGASGDDGDESGLQFPQSDPMVTAVGGTSLFIGQHGQYLGEKPWETDNTPLNPAGTAWDPAPPGTFGFGSSGGNSPFPMPAYQQGVVSGNVVNGQPMRAVPDVAAFADGDLGYPEGQTINGTFSTGVNGGTSLASPLFAAMEAGVIQARKGAPLGFVNPTLYGLANGPAFHDVTDLGPTVAVANDGPIVQSDSRPDVHTILATMGQCQEVPTLTCGTGYDTTTGLGSPAPAFYQLLAH